MSDLKVTVLMSVYNGEKYLHESIDSILNQSFKNFEFLIINDASTDNTSKIINSYDDPRITVYTNEKNLGLAKSLNIGLKLAKGRYIARMDADDVSYPERLKKQYEYMKDNPDVGIVYSWTDVIDSTGNYMYTWRDGGSPEQIYYILKFKNCLAHSSVMFDKNLICKIGGYNEGIDRAQDYELWDRVSKCSRIYQIQEPLIKWRKSNNSISAKYSDRQAETVKKVYMDNFKSIIQDDNLSIALFIKNNFENIDKDVFSKFTQEDIVKSMQLFRNINEIIVRNAPPVLDSEQIRKLSNDYFYNYMCSAFPKLNFINIIKCVKDNTDSRFNLLYVLKMLYKVFRLSIPLIFTRMGFLIRFTLRYLAGYMIYYPIEYIKYMLFINNDKLRPTTGKNNVLCIVPFMVVGGAEKVILSIAEKTDSSKFNFHIVTTERANNTWHSKFQRYFKSAIIPNTRNKNLCYKYIHHLIKKLNINTVLITNSVYGYDYIPLLKQDFKGIRIIDIIHSEFSFGAVVDQRQVAHLLDYRVCISNRLKRYMEEQYKCHDLNNGIENKLVVIYNGVDISLFKKDTAKKGKFKEKFSISDHVKIITFIGRLSSEKNPIRFVDIANKFISKFNSEVKFVIAGDGPEFEKVKNKINEYGIQDKFIMTGIYNDVPELLSDSYILIVSSDTEGIPFVILEAMAMGVPVISTNVGAISEVINNGLNSYLIDLQKNMIDVFAERIYNLINNEQTYKLFSINARIAVECNYSVDAMAKKYERLFMDDIKNN